MTQSIRPLLFTRAVLLALASTEYLYARRRNYKIVVDLEQRQQKAQPDSADKTVWESVSVAFWYLSTPFNERF